MQRRDKYYDCIKIIYPYICTKPALQILMRHEFMKLLKNSNILTEIPYINEFEEIVNTLAIYRSDWLMYGSRRIDKMELHKLTHIYHVANKKIFDALIPGDENNEKIIKYTINVCSIRKFEAKDVTYLNANIHPADIDDAFHNIIPENINIDDQLLKNNNPFQIILEEIYKKEEITDASIAKLFLTCYPNKFFYDSDLECWYYFNDFGIYHQEGNKLYTARNLMVTDFLNMIENDYDGRFGYYYKLFSELKGEECTKNINKIYKSLRNRIQSTIHQSNIICQLAIYCSIDKLHEKMDQLTPEIVAFENGVYDLQTNIFRKGKAEEYISTTTGYDYEPAKPLYIKKLNKIIKEIFPTDDERLFTLQILANGLIGLNAHEIFVCWTGPGGRNGKGLLERLTLLTLGKDYCRTINPAYLSATRIQNPASADSFIFALRNCRLLFIDEVSDTMEFDKGRLKSWSGNDIIPVRDLFQKGGGIQIKPKFMMIFLTNDIINIKNPDDAIKARLTAISFKYRFLENPDPNNKYEKKVDNTLKSKFDDNIEWRRAFFQILVEQYNIYCKNNKKLIIPDKFKEASNKILEINDPVHNFINECCEITKNKNDRILRSQLYKIFCKHYQDSHISAKMFNDTLGKKGIKVQKSCGLYYLIGIKYTNDDKLRKNLIADIANIIIENRNNKELDKMFNEMYEKLIHQEDTNNV